MPRFGIVLLIAILIPSASQADSKAGALRGVRLAALNRMLHSGIVLDSDVYAMKSLVNGLDADCFRLLRQSLESDNRAACRNAVVAIGAARQIDQVTLQSFLKYWERDIADLEPLIFELQGVFDRQIIDLMVSELFQPTANSLNRDAIASIFLSGNTKVSGLARVLLLLFKLRPDSRSSCAWLLRNVDPDENEAFDLVEACLQSGELDTIESACWSLQESGSLWRLSASSYTTIVDLLSSQNDRLRGMALGGLCRTTNFQKSLRSGSLKTVLSRFSDFQIISATMNQDCRREVLRYLSMTDQDVDEEILWIWPDSVPDELLIKMVCKRRPADIQSLSVALAYRGRNEMDLVANFGGPLDDVNSRRLFKAALSQRYFPTGVTQRAMEYLRDGSKEHVGEALLVLLLGEPVKPADSEWLKSFGKHDPKRATQLFECCREYGVHLGVGVCDGWKSRPRWGEDAIWATLNGFEVVDYQPQEVINPVESRHLKLAEKVRAERLSGSRQYWETVLELLQSWSAGDRMVAAVELFGREDRLPPRVTEVVLRNRIKNSSMRPTDFQLRALGMALVKWRYW